MKTIALVSCAQTKLETREPVPARDLYTSSLFIKSRAWAEANADHWFILSAFHGVVAPELPLMPYERSLNDLNARERFIWAMRADSAIRGWIRGHWGTDEPITVQLLAGEVYAHDLRSLLAAEVSGDLRHAVYARRCTVVEPLRGLQIGERLAWLNGWASPPCETYSQPRLRNGGWDWGKYGLVDGEPVPR